MRLRTSVTLVALLVCSPIAARADVVLDWNAIAVSTLIGQGQSPFAQARFLSITQLAVFEAVNTVTGRYKPYLGTVVATAGAVSGVIRPEASVTARPSTIATARRRVSGFMLSSSTASTPTSSASAPRHCRP